MSARYLLFCMVGCALIATQTASSGTMASVDQAPLDIPELMRNVAWNELQASQHPAHYYRYINRTVSSGSARTTEQIQTSQGVAELLLTVNGKPPNAKQRQANNLLLTRLVTDVGFRRSQLKAERQNTARRDVLIKNLPNAFVYTYAGKTKNGLIRLQFRPDPHFSPSSRQTLILQGMAGDVLIDPSSQMIAKIDGTLIKDVTIGWGFLARLNKGGRFVMEQSRGPDGTWHQKLLQVDFDGTEFIFKGLHIHEKIVRCCFERVPHDLTITEAVHMLRAHPALPERWSTDLDAIEKLNGSY